MAGAFDAKVDISTAEASAALAALRKEVTGLGKDLAGLNTIIKNSNGDLKTIAAAFTQLVAAQRAATSAAKEMAQADIAAARAAGIRNVADAKVEETLARRTNQEAQAARASAQTGLATARTAESETRRTIAMDRSTAAAQRAAQSQSQLHDSMSNSRYLMYDVGATYGVLAAGLMAIPAATAAVAVSYQKDFAQVQRVTDGLDQTGLKNLKENLKAMGTEMPIGFDEISRIAQLGAQMGVANEELAAFTETTAKFVAVTGISADTGATLFGRMETSFTADVQKFPDFFERLGSSIARVGADTVATDPEIAAMLAQIGPLGAAAGMSAANVTGLAAALASVRVQPELARGTLTRVFGQLNRDVAEGAPQMEAFGKLMGMTADQAGKLWQTDSSTFFNNLIKGLHDTQQKNGELTTTFDQLGITASRDVSALTKLAVGYDTLQLSMDSANKGFTDGTALNEMSKVTFETISAKLMEMANSWKNFADTIATSGPALQVVGVFVDTLKNIAIGLDSLVKKAPVVGLIINALMGFAAVTALFLGFKAAQAFVTAGMIGFQQAASRGMAGGLNLSTTLRTLAQTMLVAKGATDAQSRALLEQVGVLRGLMIASATTSEQLRSGAAGSFGVLATSTGRATGGIGGFRSALVGLTGGPIGLAVAALALLTGGLINAGVEADAAGKAIAAGLKQGADAGLRAVAEQLANRKVTMFDGALGFSDIDKNVTQIAERSGVAFDKVVAAIGKGEDGMKSFKAELEKVAKANGFKDLNDALANPTPGSKAADLQFLNKVVTEYSAKTKDAAKTTTATSDALKTLGVPAEDAAGAMDDATTSVDKMTKALKELNDTAFGTINAQSDLQDALVKIGQGLHAGNSFNPNNDSGRTNIKNVQDALTKARDYYKNLMDTQQITAQQAAQGYTNFTEKLMGDIRTKFGANTAYIDQMAQQTTVLFQSAIGGKPVSVPVTTVPGQVQAAAVKANATLQDFILAQGIPTIPVNAKTDAAQSETLKLVGWLATVTKLPYKVVLDALTNPASEKSKEIYALLQSITDHTYTAPVDADTSAAITNIQNFSAYARKELANLQYAMQGLGPGGVGLDASADKIKAAKSKYASIIIPAQTTAPTQVRAQPQAIPDLPPDLAPQLDNVANGYKNAADAADKAGKKAKESAKDIASGIEDSVRAAEDYGNRLKTALMSAYNQQYALTTATDEYHSALNAITKKRQDEIKQVEDLRDKIRQLNDERDKELITANKAKIEQNISIKYGEVDRAADYGNQAKTALDNAAAKQKEIDASSKEAKTIQDGIGLLTGYSDAAIANRAALRGLETKMIDMVAAYATLGHSSEEVRAYAQALTGQYKIDVGQLGFNMAAVDNLQGSFQRYIDTINRVPQVVPTQVDANTDAAQQQFDDLNGALDRVEVPRTATVTVDLDTSAATAKMRSLEAQIKGGTDGIGGDVSLTAFRPGSLAGGYTGGAVSDIMGMYSGGMVPGTPPSDRRADNKLAQVDGKGLIKIRSREFIQPQEAVDYYGVDMMEAIRTMSLPKFNMGGSPSGTRSGGGAASQAVVDLGAATLAALADMRQEIKLFTDNRLIAESANAGNKQLAAEGHH